MYVVAFFSFFLVYNNLYERVVHKVVHSPVTNYEIYKLYIIYKDNAVDCLLKLIFEATMAEASWMSMSVIFSTHVLCNREPLMHYFAQ